MSRFNAEVKAIHEWRKAVNKEDVGRKRAVSSDEAIITTITGLHVGVMVEAIKMADGTDAIRIYKRKGSMNADGKIELITTIKG